MSLTPGTRLGPYEVVAKIGEGGMGEVYRATDTKLNRDAALKILPDSFTADPDRRARFTREAQVLASLSHPNIAGIYGFEDGSGTPVLAGGSDMFPRWRSDGNELFYLTGISQGQVMSVEVNGSGSSFVAGTPVELFEPGTYGTVGPGHRGNFFPWAVSPDGQRFLMPQPVSGAKGSASPTINVILNWTSLLKK